jgi:hypothetical protein
MICLVDMGPRVSVENRRERVRKRLVRWPVEGAQLRSMLDICIHSMPFQPRIFSNLTGVCKGYHLGSGSYVSDDHGLLPAPAKETRKETSSAEEPGLLSFMMPWGRLCILLIFDDHEMDHSQEKFVRTI